MAKIHKHIKNFFSYSAYFEDDCADIVSKELRSILLKSSLNVVWESALFNEGELKISRGLPDWAYPLRSAE